MGYANRTDIEHLFGKANVQTWADLDNDGDAQAIQDRIDTALAFADSFIDDRFRRSKYAVPLKPEAGATLDQITDVAARLAGWWLYANRGQDEQDIENRPYNRMDTHFRRAQRAIDRYLAGKDTLPAIRADDTGEAPFVA